MEDFVKNKSVQQEEWTGQLTCFPMGGNIDENDLLYKDVAVSNGPRLHQAYQGV